jgi:hypothetical protein
MTEQIIRCEYAGKEVKSYTGAERACKYCDGVIRIRGNYYESPKVTAMLPKPIEADCGFTCKFLELVARGVS